jgi:hypothetical protein
VQRNLDDVLIVDVDAHHYESENYSEFLSTWRTTSSSSSRCRDAPRTARA